MTTFDPKSYWESRLRARWGLHGVGYQGFGPQYNRWIYRIQTTVFRRTLRSLRRDWSKMSVLDIGSGTGHFVKLWQEAGAARVTGADLTDVVVENLRRNFPDVQAFSLDVGGDIPAGLAEQQFDVVSAIAVLFHVVDDRRYAKAFANIASLVRPGGLFLFSENFVHGQEIRTEAFVCRTLVETKALVEANGFRIVRRVPLFVLMNRPFDTRSAWPRHLWDAALKPVRRFRWLGNVAGVLLYPADVLLTAVLKEGPSTELMVCERVR